MMPTRLAHSWKKKCATLVAVATFMIAFFAAPAVAQMTTGEPQEEGKPIIQWVCFILFIVITVAIATKNPKRSHQD